MKKKLQVAIMVLITIAAVYGFAVPSASGVSGKIIPPEGAVAVWAISSTDSIGTKPVAGSFNLELKPGWYSIIIQTNQPYKQIQIDKMEVQDGKTINLGEIKLEK
jgi:hypothetical protein